jgi:flagellar basal-body rod protein FlgC
MSLENIMQVAGLSMDAQTVRMNLSVSNVANADTLSSSPAEAYKAKRPVFKTILESESDRALGRIEGGVRIAEIAEDQAPHPAIYDPSHPNADARGYVHGANVDVMQEMVDITAASRAFESAVEASNTAKRLMTRTIEMLQK